MSKYQYILLFPLIGSLLAGLLGRYIGKRPSQLIAIAGLIFSFIISMQAFRYVIAEEGNVIHEVIFSWIFSGEFKVSFGMLIDRITVIMLIVVTGISSLIHIYSLGYMDEDPDNPRFFSYLSFFTFSMLMLIIGDNFLQLFFGWEGVGLASYLLIGFWFKKAGR
ncbi:MAG: hypothetical protein H7832_08410 [Magnetococcus sp. DMHC-6]